MAAITDWELTKSEIPKIMKRRLPAKVIAATGASLKTDDAFEVLRGVLAQVNAAIRKAGLDPASITYADATETDYITVRRITEIGFCGEVLRAERSGLAEDDPAQGFIDEFRDWLEEVVSNPEGTLPDIAGGSTTVSGSVRSTFNRLNMEDSGEANDDATPPKRTSDPW